MPCLYRQNINHMLLCAFDPQVNSLDWTGQANLGKDKFLRKILRKLYLIKQKIGLKWSFCFFQDNEKDKICSLERKDYYLMLYSFW